MPCVLRDRDRQYGGNEDSKRSKQADPDWVGILSVLIRCAYYHDDADEVRTDEA